MIGFFAGLIRGVGKYYNEDLKVTKRNETTVSIAFLGKSSTLKSNAPKHQTNIIKKILSLFRSFLFK